MKTPVQKRASTTMLTPLGSKVGKVTGETDVKKAMKRKGSTKVSVTNSSYSEPY